MSGKPIDYRILVDRYLDDALDPREAAELSRLMETRPEVAAYFAEASQLYALLHEHETARIQPHIQDKGPGKGESDTARILYSESPKEPARVTRGELHEKKRTTRRSLKSFSGGRDRQYLVPVLVAAGVLFGIVLLFSLSSSGPSRPEPGRGESVSREREKAEREAGKRKAEEDRTQAERARKEAEARLVQLREDEKRAEQVRLAASGAQEGETRRKTDEAFAEATRKRKEEEERVTRLRQQEEAAKEAVAKASSEAKLQEKPVDPTQGKPLDPAPTKTVTQVLVAKLERVEGEVHIVSASGKVAAKGDEDLLPGQGLEAVGPASYVVLNYPDKTRLEAGPDTELRELKAAGGKRVHVAKGEIRVVVSRQPKDEAMLFTFRDGEATVLGTTLRIAIDPDPKKGTRLDVEEGKVGLKNPTGKTVLVESGYFAVSAAGVGLVPKRTVSQWTLDLGSGVSMAMVSFTPGTFMMGSTEAPNQLWQLDERPAHRVTITKGFSLGKYEVTRGQFGAFVKATGYKTDADRAGMAWGGRADGSWGEIQGANWKDPVAFKQTDDHPVICISWNDAKAFSDWAAKRTGRGVRLPTEAEWEFACRAGTRARWWFGDNEASIVEHGWTNGNSGLQTHPVGQKKPNPWGLFDMYGNVWEWCEDWAGRYAGDAVDPTGPASGDRRCLRGGSWSTDSTPRVAIRRSYPPSDRVTDCGFRVALP